MSNIKISELPTASTLGTTDLTPIVQAGGTKQTTLGALFTLLAGFLAAGTGAIARTFQSKGRDVISVTDFGATGDGTTDDQTAFSNALTAAAGGALWIPKPSVAYRINTGALVIPDGTVIFGCNSHIDYRGTGACFEIRNSRNIAIYDPYIDLTNGGVNAIGLWVRGVQWLNIYKPQIFPNDLTHTGILIETSQTGGNDFGAYMIEIHNPRIQRITNSGLYGIRTVRTVGDVVSVTHLNVYGGWSKGNTYGMHLRSLSGGHINGFVADTGTDGINIDNSGQMVLSPGELGGSGGQALSGYSVNYGASNVNVTFQAPNLAVTGALGYTQNGTGSAPVTVRGISGTSTDARNLRDFKIISDGNTSATVTFSVNEANNTYFVVASAAGTTGTPAAGSLRVSIAGKGVGGFTINLEVAPGVGSSVQVNWILIR